MLQSQIDFLNEGIILIMVIKAVRGTRDIMCDEAKRLQFIRMKAAHISGLFGYDEIITPMFEKLELFSRGIGESSDIVSKEMYSWQDKKGRVLALRPENTAGVVRSLIENKIISSQEISRWYYFGPMFRYERPQTGRYRQFWQFGAEAFGESSPEMDAEVLALATQFLFSIGLKDTYLHINSIGCQICRQSFREALKKYFEPMSDKLCINCKERLDTNPLRILDCKEVSCQPFFVSSPVPRDYLCEECKTHHSRLQKLLELYNIRYYNSDRLVRGLDYYTKTVFEFTGRREGSQNALLAGGRYDNLVKELNGPLTPAVGFAAGVDRLMLEMSIDIANSGDNIFFAVWTSEKTRDVLHKIIQELRRDNIAVRWSIKNKSVKSQFRIADKSGVDVALVLGDEELDNNMIKIKFLKEDGKEEMIPIGDIGKFCRDYEKHNNNAVH